MRVLQVARVGKIIGILTFYCIYTALPPDYQG